MGDRAGDPDKKPPECKVGRGGDSSACKNLKEVNRSDMETETYSCEVCGEYFKLYYEDMQ